MINVFEHFLSQEFGRARYKRYFESVKKALDDKSYAVRKRGSEELYLELFLELKDEDDTALKKKLESLIDAMCLAVRIHRQYMFVTLFYVSSCLFLVAKQLDGMVTFFSLILISCCFLYKTWEFVINKYCYVDANIILVYKSVLDRIIAERK